MLANKRILYSLPIHDCATGKAFDRSNTGVRGGRLPGCGAAEGLASGAERDEGRDHREDEPRAEEPPPVELGGEVERHHPHLEQGHQLWQWRGEEGCRWWSRDNGVVLANGFLYIADTRVL